jgi:hypothetical protein
MFKLLYSLFFTCLFSWNVSAQFGVIDFYTDLGVSSFPRTYNEVINVFNYLTLEVTNLTNEPQEIYISIEIYKDGQLFARTRRNYRGIALSLQPLEMRQLRRADFEALDIVITLDDIEFQDGFNLGLNPFLTILPEGMYSICPVAFDANSFPNEIQLSEAYPISCSDMYFVEHDLQVFALMPFDDECIPITNLNQPFSFNWMLLSSDPNTQMTIDYILKIIDITDLDANPVDQIFNTAEVVSNIRIPLQNLNDHQTLQFFPAIDGVGMEIGRRYAWRIDAEIPGNEFSGEFITPSEVMIFTLGGCDGDDVFMDLDELDACQCELTEPLDPNPHSSLSSVTAFRAGRFIVRRDNSQGGWTIQNNRFSGKGLISINFTGSIQLEVKVDLQNVQINKDNRMLSGTITCSQETSDGFNINDYLSQAVNTQIPDINLPDNYQLPPVRVVVPQAEKINGFIASLGPLANMIQGTSRGMPIALKQQYNGMELVVGITDIFFTPTSSYFNLVVNIPFEFNGRRYISFGGWVCGGANGFANEGKLYLAEDFILGQNFGIESAAWPVITFHGVSNSSDPQNMATYLSFDCNGIESGVLNGSVQLPTNYFVKEENGESTSQPALMHFHGGFTKSGGSGNSTLDWMATLTSESAIQLKQMPGWGFTINEAVFDFSELENHTNLILPNDHILNSSQNKNLWKGVSINKINLRYPDYLNLEELIPFQSKTGDIFNMMIDLMNGEFNFYLNINERHNNYRADFGGGWQLTYDSTIVNVRNFDLLKLRLRGSFHVPVLHEEDHFVYTCTFSPNLQGDLDYAFMIGLNESGSNTASVKIPLLVSRASLSRESHITLDYKRRGSENREWQFNLKLFGQLHVGEEIVRGIVGSDLSKFIPFEMLGLPFMLKFNDTDGFEGSYFSYTPAIANMISSEIAQIHEKIGGISDLVSGELSFPSIEDVQPKFAGFGLKISEFGIGGSISNPEVSIGTFLNLSPSESFGFGGGTKININSEFNTNLGRYVYKDWNIECVSLSITQPRFSFRGQICYKSDNNQRRFDGELLVQIPAGFEVGMEATFGTIFKQNKSVDYNFWRFRALFYKPMGIPMGGSGLSIYAFMGGFAWNMRQDPISSVEASGANPNRRQQLFNFVSSGGADKITYSPSKGEHEFSAGVLLGLAGKAEVFNFDVNLTFTLGKNNTKIKIHGSAYVMSALNGDANKSTCWADVDLTIGTNPFYIDGGLQAYLKIMPHMERPIVRGSQGNNRMVDAKFLIKPSTKEYYLHMGSPSDAGGVKFNLLGMGTIDASLYYMMGTGLPTSIELPREIRALLAGSSARHNESNSQAGVNNSVSTSGQRQFNDGFGIAFGTMIKVDIEADKWFVELDVIALAGFDLNITHSTNRECGNYKPPGVDGWYSMGQIYAGLQGKLKVMKVELVNLKAVAYAQGAFPNPTWARGELKVSYSIYSAYVGSFLRTSVRCPVAGLFDALECSVSWASDNLNCDWERTAEECGLGNWFNDYIKGSFNASFEFGDVCIPRFTGDTPPFGDIRFIKSITPADGSENVDFLLDRVQVEFSVDIPSTPSLPHYENDVVVNRRVQVSLEKFQLKRVSNGQIIKASTALSSLGKKSTLTLQSGDLLPETEYEVLVELLIQYDIRNSRGGSNRKEMKEIKKIRFKTRKVPDNLELQITGSYPGVNQLFVLPDNYKVGYINFRPNHLKYYIDNRIINSGFAWASGFTIEIENILDPGDKYKIPILKDSEWEDNINRGRIKYYISEVLNRSLKTKSFYKLTLYAEVTENGVDKEIEVSSYRFATSNYASLDEKLSEIKLVNDRFHGLCYLLKEPFDSYDATFPSIVLTYGISDEYQDLMSNHFLEPLLNQNSPPPTFNYNHSFNYHGKKESIQVSISKFDLTRFTLKTNADGNKKSFHLSNDFYSWVNSVMQSLENNRGNLSISNYIEANESRFNIELAHHSFASNGESVTTTLGLPPSSGSAGWSLPGLGSGNSNIPGFSNPFDNIRPGSGPIPDDVNDHKLLLPLPENFTDLGFFDAQSIRNQLTLVYNKNLEVTYQNLKIEGNTFSEARIPVGKLYKRWLDQYNPGWYQSILSGLNVLISYEHSPSQILARINYMYNQESYTIDAPNN